MSNAARIAKNSFFEVATYGARSVSLILVPLFLARLGGAELLGGYVSLINLAALFVFLAAFGLPRLLTREIARQREDKERVAQLVNAALGLVAIFSIVSITFMLMIGRWLGYPTILMRALLLTGIALAFESMENVVAASFRGAEEMERSSAVAFVAEVALLALVLVIVPLNKRIDWLMAAYLLSRVISLGMGASLYRLRFGRRVGWVIDTALWRALLKTAWPFALNEAVTLFQGRLGVIILSFYAGNATVGILEVATSLTLRVNVLGRAVNDSLYPFLSSQFLRDAPSLRTYTAKSIRFLVIPGFLIATILWVFGKDLVPLLYGEEFIAAIWALKWLAILIPFRFVTNSLAMALTASNRQEKRSMAVATTAVTNVLLNLILIPTYHMMGAVYATLFTDVVLCGLVMWHLRAEVRDMINWRALAAPALSSLMILGSSLVLGMINIWLLIMLSVLLYALTIVALDRSSIKLLRLIATRRRP